MQTRAIKEIIESITTHLQKNKDYLNELDRAVGDGDHGSNIYRGFEAVLADSQTWEDLNLSATMKKIGMVLLGKVGGASGVLYASACLKISQGLNKESFNNEDFLNAMKVGIAEIMLKGKSKIGDKTMLDAMSGFTEAFAKKMQETSDFYEIFKYAVNGAKEGDEKTKDMVAKSGRASYLGERSIGHIDAGATSFCVIAEGILEYLEKNRG
ncbi:MAG: dihydroxyacetone kinase subunit L [Alphaproteobacteria bacterium]|jgi:dihydroxyacetone kinase-like protein|nr:dihydroxyacetone kinase subunit L [Alphaproteobacteria bacterium]